ncbi:MAG: TlpA family protein disulfide reductase, partial [Flavobacteriales bacterium]
QVRIETEAENMAANYTVEGSPGSSKLRELTGFMLENYTKIDSLKNAMRQHQSLGDYNAYTAAATKASILQARLAKFVMDFIDANPKSLASLVAVGVLNPDDHYAYFKKVVDSLADVVPEQAFYTLLRDKVKQWSVLAPGATAPDITLKDVLGSPRSLSSFRGDVVLLDFWASWCRPCRMQNPQLVKLHNKYGKQGFTIFSVSLDGMPQQKDPESDWKRAIQQDGLAWPNHVSDLRGWNSAVVPLYRIEGIPMTILLDKEGIIVAKNLHGQLLEDKIKSLLGVD